MAQPIAQTNINTETLTLISNQSPNPNRTLTTERFLLFGSRSFPSSVVSATVAKVSK